MQVHQFLVNNEWITVIAETKESAMDKIAIRTIKHMYQVQGIWYSEIAIKEDLNSKLHKVTELEEFYAVIPD